MVSGVNLTPPQEIRRRRTQYVVGAATKMSVLLVLVLAGVAVYYFVKSSTLHKQIADLDSRGNDLTSQRDSMAEVEGYAKKLSGKYFLLQKYLESRLKYSSVISELLARVPKSVLFTDLDLGGAGQEVKVSGKSGDVISISAFINGLAKEGNASSGSGVVLDGQRAFLDVRLESLKVDEIQKSVDYSIVFKVNEKAFLK